MQNGLADVTQAGMLEVFNRLFDLIVPYSESKLIYVTRAPKPMTSLGSITKQFTIVVWITSASTIFALAALLYLTHTLYQVDHIKMYTLAKEEKLKANIWIFPFAKITEPEPLPWFKKWSAGKMVVLLWSVLSTFLAHFYTSNFRASLIAVEYEEPPTTLQNVVDRGERVYIFDLAVFLR